MSGSKAAARPPVDRKGLTCVDAADGLPASLEAERTLLGGILLDNGVYGECRKALVAEDFYLHAHQLLFTWMGALLKSGGSPVDAVTLANAIPKAEQLSMGGLSWLASLTEGLPRRRPMTHGCYIEIVKEKAALRRIIVLASEAAMQALDSSEKAIAIGRNLMRELTVLFGRAK